MRQSSVGVHMRQTWSWILGVCLFLSTTMLWADSKSAEFVKSLREDPSFKVRAKAADLLSKSGDTSTTSALIESLQKDENEIVRAAAAASLGILASLTNEKTALKALKTAFEKDKSALVRDESQKAISRFVLPDGGGVLINDVCFTFGKFTNTSKVTDAALTSNLKNSLYTALQKKGKVTPKPPTGKKPLTIDGSIQKVETSKTGNVTTVMLVFAVTITREASILGNIQKEGGFDIEGKVSPQEETSTREELISVLVADLSEDISKNLSKWK